VRSHSRISPKLPVAAAIVGLTLIGWVAQSTLAQNSSQAPAPAPRPPTATDSVLDLPSQKPGDPLPSEGKPAPPAARAPFELDQENRLPAAASSDDPEKNVQAFLEQNRKVAEAQLQNLRDEAEKLRARLQKVESVMKRWEALLAALQRNETDAADLSPLDPVSKSANPSQALIKRRPQFNARAVSPPAPANDAPPPPQAPISDRPAPPSSAEPAPAPRLPQAPQ
jgi:hypothetical protein